MLIIGGVLVLLLAAFVIYIVAAYFIMKLMLVAVAVGAGVLYVAIFVGLNATYGDANVPAELAGAFAIGTSLLVCCGWACRQAKVEDAKRLAQAEADRLEAQRALVLAKAANPDAWCPCGSGLAFRACHGTFERPVVAPAEPIAQVMKQTWTALKKGLGR